jgi:hypothetical protein
MFVAWCCPFLIDGELFTMCISLLDWCVQWWCKDSELSVNSCFSYYQCDWTGAGVGSGFPGLSLGFGVGAGCGIGIGFGYGFGKGVAYDENGRYSNIGRSRQRSKGTPSE